VSTKGGFLRWKGSKHLQACKEMQEPCRSKDQAVSIQEGQLFKVVTLAVSDTGLSFWQLAGGIGFVQWFDPYKKNMEGPLPPDEATAVATELEKAVTLPSASDMASFKGLSKFNDMWGSKPAQTSKDKKGTNRQQQTTNNQPCRKNRLSLEVCSSLEEFLRMAYSGLQPALMASQPVLPMRASPWF